MATDDLDAPLGQGAEKKRRSFRIPSGHSACDRGPARPVRRDVCRLGAGGQRSAGRRADDRGLGRDIDADAGCRRRTAGSGQIRRAHRGARRSRRRATSSPSSTAAPASARKSRWRRRRAAARRPNSGCSKPPSTAPSRKIGPDGKRPADAYARVGKLRAVRAARASPSSSTGSASAEPRPRRR